MAERHFQPHKKGVWFVYDGDCPLCSKAAIALRIKHEHGSLQLFNARAEQSHPLLLDIRQRRLDLDEGMVIFDGEHFYHGANALWFMAKYSDHSGWFNHLNRALFRSKTIAAIVYPLLRAGRNLLIRVRGVKKLNNLDS